MRNLVKLFHFISLFSYSFSVYYDFNQILIPEHALPAIIQTGFGGRLRFMTYWNMYIQTVYFTICVINDIFGTNEVQPKQPSKIRKIRDFIFSAFAFPMAIIVATSFWSIYAVDRDLIFPKEVEAFFPNWLNHVMHRNIILFVVLHLVICFRKYPDRKTGITGITGLLLTYGIWAHLIFFVTGQWVYPLLAAVNIPVRLLLWAASMCFGAFSYLAGEFLNNCVWAKEIQTIKSDDKRQK